LSIVNCPNCGGTHYGSLRCPFQSAPCVVCKTPTIYACSDCAIDTAGTVRVHVCEKPDCQRKHEELHPESQPEFISDITLEARKAQEVDFAGITRRLDAIGERVADLVDANDPERNTIREISKLVRHGHKCMDLTFRKDGKEYRFQADWVARLFRSQSRV
jgi:hypothetical protein